MCWIFFVLVGRGWSYLGCSTGRWEVVPWRLWPHLGRGFTRTQRCHPAISLQRRQRRFPSAGYECAGTPQVLVFRCSIEAKGSVDTVHTFHLRVARTTTGLARIPHVFASSQCFQALESPSSPTSGTADRSSEGYCAHSGWSGPTDTHRGICLAAGSPQSCEVETARLQVGVRAPALPVASECLSSSFNGVGDRLCCAKYLVPVVLAG